jgi:hypothetical protein
VLGSQLTLSNKTNKDQVFEIAVDRENKRYPQSTAELFNDYLPEDLPFRGKAGTLATNSEAAHRCWFVENP